jgi:hypothetical protein|tara:strand:- start:170 stop:397 length:228 start_codon:yes stop_codon:yes gene_type:complete
MLYRETDMKRLAYEALKHKYEAQQKDALFVYANYTNNPAGIGEHPDLLEEMDKAVQNYADAEDKLAALAILDSEA